jgi:hypothetical protein
MALLRGNVHLFIQVAALLRERVWAGGEPHPDDRGAASIADALRALDDEEASRIQAMKPHA